MDAEYLIHLATIYNRLTRVAEHRPDPNCLCPNCLCPDCQDYFWNLSQGIEAEEKHEKEHKRHQKALDLDKPWKESA